MLEKLTHRFDEPGSVISLIKAPDDVIEDELVCSQHPRLTHNDEHFLVPFATFPPLFLVFIEPSICGCIHFLYGGKVGGAVGTQVLRAPLLSPPVWGR